MVIASDLWIMWTFWMQVDFTEIETASFCGYGYAWQTMEEFLQNPGKSS